MKYALTCLLFLSGYITNAQSCTGGLGDPIVNISFGAGPDFGAPLASGITNLDYIAGNCPDDGQYTITNSTHTSDNCHPNTWLGGATDHTGNSSGYFMLVNASYAPSQFYVQAISGLCVATTYQFGAWVMNIASHPGQILPNLTFRIEKPDGTLLQSQNSGDIPVTNPARWNQVVFNFTTPPGVSSVVMRMINNAPGGQGNDLALDDITFRPAGPALNLQVTNFPHDTLSVCENDHSTLSFESAVEKHCYAVTAYQWQQSMDKGVSWANIPGATNPTYDRLPTLAGNYLYRFIVAPPGNINLSSCSVVSNPITVLVNKVPASEVTISPSANPVCPGVPVSFTATPTNGGSQPSYRWTVNGDSVGTNNPRYTDTFANGDLVNCLMTGNLACSVPVTADNTVTMAVPPLPTILLPPDTIITAGESIRLSPVVTGDIATWSWSPATGLDDPHSSNPLAMPATTVTYQLEVASQAGCTASAKETVKVFHGLEMPLAFTPNGDGKNDLFRVPPSEPVTVIRLAVYNRWGAIVFATTNSSGGWDGTLNGQAQPTGTYVWQVEYMDLVTKKAVVKSGTVVLVR
jgi:gliding motility-associated-like protein